MNDFLLLLLSLSLSGTVIAGLSFAVKAIWKKKLSKSVLYYLWLAALVRLVLPFSFEGALLNRIYEGSMKAAVPAISVEQTAPIASAQTAFSITTISEPSPVKMAETVSSPTTASVIAPAAASVEMPVITAMNNTPAKSFDFMSLLPYLWLAGFALFFGYALVSYNVFIMKLKKVNRPADGNILKIGKQLGCKIRIYRNPLAKTPMLIGVFRQSIILPDVNYTDEELKGALAHELAHKRRHDLLYKWFALFVNAVHWFNPVVWLVRREVGHACELSCDEAVIKNLQANEKQSYGETLINLAAAHRYPAGVISTTLCEEKQTLKERLGAIMTYTKKGVWNKILSCVLIVAIAATGMFMGACISLNAQKIGYPDAVNIYAPNFFNYSYTDNAKQIRQQWLDGMYEKYGVKLNIISAYKDAVNNGSSSSITGTVSENSSSSTSKPIIDEQGNTNFPGLTSIGTVRELKQYIQYDCFMPLEDYLADNPIWKALPDDLKSVYEVDGHIYAIPASASRVLSSRTIKNEALQETGITVTDLDSFRNFAVTYLQKTGNPAMGSASVVGMIDILNAFGLYPESRGYYPFCYDPTDDSVVDFMTKDNAVEALEYLRELYKAGAIFHYTTLTGNPVASGYRKYYNNFYFSYSDEENRTELFNLNPKYPQAARTSINGFAMTKDTPHPQETINFLIDMLFGSEQNYLDCWLGSSDNYTLNKDGTITIKTTDSNGHAIYPAMPNLTGGLPGVFTHSNADIFYSQNGVVDMGSTDIGKFNASLKLQYDALKNGAVIEIPLSYQNLNSATYDSKSSIANRLFDNCFRDAIVSPNKTVQQIVDEYKKAMLDLGGNQMLDEMNAAVGKKTAYYYG